MISETEKGSVEAPYEDFAQIIDEIYEGKQAFYLRLIGTNLYMVLQKTCFTIGKPDDFRTFIQEKTGKPVEYIKY